MNNGTNWQEMKGSKEIIFKYVIKIVWNANYLIIALSETSYTNKKTLSYYWIEEYKVINIYSLHCILYCI
jgi:hypothetical protein